MMGERKSYQPGTFSWVDLSTSDPEAAKSFYEALFGWTHEDLPTGNGTYTMFRLNGKDVAAVSQQQPDEANQGIPPHWNNYVTVEDVDQSAGKVSGLGGTVLVEPFDVLDAGRMAVVADPTGAVFMLWQAKNNIGAGIVNEPGALSWNEESTKDIGKAKDFYSSLFGWSYEDFADGAYSVIHLGDRSNGGIRPQSEQEAAIPPNWLPYFAVGNCDEGAAKASELGGTVMMPPMDVLVEGTEGRIAILTDPQGAAFALYSGQLDA
jgi:predicted enzyme related to lactoylglutathione lyase